MSLTRRTGRGFALLAANTVVRKSLTVGTQVVLASVLIPEDFGIVALAFTVTALLGLIQPRSVADFLIAHRSELERWSSPALLISASLGTLLSIATLVSGPIAAEVFDEARLPELLTLLAIVPLMESAAVVPRAHLQAGMRFGALAAINLGSAITSALVAVLLALNDVGALSLIMARISSVAVEALGAWLVAKPRLGMWPRWSEVRQILPSNVSLLTANSATVVVGQADYALLGIFQPADIVGVYFFAFRMSAQVLSIAATSASRVLMPAYERLNAHPDRQRAAFTRSAMAIALIGLPVCVFQAAVAPDAFALLFGDRWMAAVPVMQVLSAGWALRLVAAPATSMLMAAGRYSILNALWWSYAVAYVTVAGLAAFAAEAAIDVAIPLAAVMAVTGPIHTYVALRTQGGGLRDLVTIYGSASAAAAMAAVVGFIALEGMQEGVLRLGVLAAVVPLTYLSALWLIDRDTWRLLAALLPARLAKA